MTLEELKNQEVDVKKRAEELVKALGLTGNERSVVKSLVRGDKFTLVNMTKVTLQPRDGQTTTFVPTVFGTSNGASIGAKHFASVNIEGAPAVGSTPLENAMFLVWCIDHEVEFKVLNVDEDPVPAQNGVAAYTKKNFKLTVSSMKEENS